VTLALERPTPTSRFTESVRPALSQLAVGATYLAAATTPWNGWRLGPLRPGDLFIFLGLLLFAAADLGRAWPRLPTWSWLFGGIILIVTVAHEILPTDPGYLARRVVLDAAGNVGIEIESNLTVGLKFLVPIVFMPFLFALAQQQQADAVRRSAVAFTVGSGISALLGFASNIGLTNFAAGLTGVESPPDRAAGLTVHPNFLATTCVTSVPILLYLALAPRLQTRVFALGLLACQLLGVYASGSRGGASVLVFGALLSFAVIPGYRRLLPTLGFLLGLATVYVFVAKPSLGESLLRAVRLTGNSGDSVSGSNYVRSAVGAQGMRDFWHSPIDGVGMQVAAEAHNVYIQALASGGLLMFTGYLTFVLGGLLRAVAAMRSHPIAYPLFVSAVCGAVLATVENSLVDRLAYVALSLIAVLAVPPGTLLGKRYAD
jgi:hypothetical protein